MEWAWQSSSERLFNFERIEQLDAQLAATALTEPAAGEGVTWDGAAVDLLVYETAGYPYFLQQYGQEAWNAASGESISFDDARVAAVSGRAALDSGFFRSQWDRATRVEQRYLRAMAAGGDEGSAVRDIAARMGRSVQSTGPARASLIGKGLVYAPEHGFVAFTVPGMASYIQRQPEDE